MQFVYKCHKPGQEKKNFLLLSDSSLFMACFGSEIHEKITNIRLLVRKPKTDTRAINKKIKISSSGCFV